MNRQSDVVFWLESPEGERWSRSRHAPVGHIFVMVKDDDPLASDFEVDLIWYVVPDERMEEMYLDRYLEAV